MAKSFSSQMAGIMIGTGKAQSGTRESSKRIRDKENGRRDDGRFCIKRNLKHGQKNCSRKRLF
jgi:hypothetical protein